MADCPNATLTTFGPDVGLPKGQMGNSEVGHTNIGAGRVVAMDLGQIDLAIEDGSFFKEQALLDFIDTLKASGGTAHLLGLVSDGGVHGHTSHMIAAAKAITDAGVPVAIHAITDGRDVAPKSARTYLKALKEHLPEGATIVTVGGRYFAMDRDNRWDRVEKAYRTMLHGEGRSYADPLSVIRDGYGNDQTDEFIPPSVITRYKGMQNGDGVFCLNFRADRAREILAAIGDIRFEGFSTAGAPKLAARLGMVDYSTSHNDYMTTVFPKQKIKNTLGAWVAKQGLKQLRLAETEKYPHVTFFLNGGKEDLQPEMSAGEVSDKLVDGIYERYNLIVVNYANPDMVGHTGDLEAAKKACEAVDQGLGRALKALDVTGGAMIITADHGNCDIMIDPETGNPHTAHTLNPVPVILVGGPEGAKLADGKLADLAPSLLQLMQIEKPQEMTGKSLIS